MDEFEQIARLFRPLTLGAPEALDLMDDAAVIAGRPGLDLVVTKDAMVAGVHFLADDPLDLVARKLLRVNLSDLAAKAAEPFGYFLAVAWPGGCGDGARARFAAGLGEDQARFGLKLLGGDTVSTPGPLTLSATLMGWVAHGRMVRRSGARPGDGLYVSGTIGDGGLGLQAARGALDGATARDVEALARRYRLPEPRLALRSALLDHASAAADVSDGLLADAAHIGEASAVGVEIALDRIPLSGPARAWCGRHADPLAAMAELGSFGDDYEIVCTASPAAGSKLTAAAAQAGVALTRIGAITQAPGLRTTFEGRDVTPARLGWRHG